MKPRHEILILDFGSQYTQLIARRIRECRVYCQIVPFNVSLDAVRRRPVSGIVLSGGPMSVLHPDSPLCDPGVFELGVPVLGICYGLQLAARLLGGEVRQGICREYGRAVIRRIGQTPLLDGVPDETVVWMSHGDDVRRLPPGFRAVAESDQTIAAAEHSDRRWYGLQFHPEVAHTREGTRILRNFLFTICGCRRSWSLASFAGEQVRRIREQVGAGQVICALSGGVDSTVAATLVHRAVGRQQLCLFVDNGLLRQAEFADVLERYRQLELNIVPVDAARRFLAALAGVADPEAKRKIIGQLFIEVFEAEARKLGRVDFLVQGTLYPDVIESVSVRGPSAVIKSHHNVGGLPDRMNLKLIEPLRELFKDEVRRLGRRLGIPDTFIQRQPFPGPGLAVRHLGPVTPEGLDILRRADGIVLDEIRAAGLYTKLWQSFAVLLPVRSVGVMGDERTYEYTVAVRAVKSEDGMTADWVRLPYAVLERISTRIVNEVHGVNRVVYDISAKPPSTIEWE
ncbi:MAG TPA: glutamine-hydrolyzing GMP synthase [Acidobacteriota bacterium]|nr:glutamine-hydrolyzing GMP synthase [Acidobacteriota bacterium]HQF86372.1 glutamine-hydrolyzing GMP synthase [Acidobacteriota bacterium]HQG90385.1 glutamine-hydrolyzing GMP synthase [Acidobacteriota bacterium]